MNALWLPALGIALMSFVESIAAARSFARSDDPPVDADQELFALGIANIAGAFTQSYPAGGGTSQTAVNNQAGARSQVAELVTAGAVVLTLIFLAPLVGLLPEAALGAVVLVAAIGLVKPVDFRTLGQFHRVELIWALVALLGVVVLGTLQGIVVAVVVSLATVLYHTNHPAIYTLGEIANTGALVPLDDDPEAIPIQNVLVLRSAGLFYFASATRTIEALRAAITASGAQTVILDCSGISNFDYTALVQLAAFEAELAANGTRLSLAALPPQARLSVDNSALAAQLGRDRIFLDVQVAVKGQDAMGHW